MLSHLLFGVHPNANLWIVYAESQLIFIVFVIFHIISISWYIINFWNHFGNTRGKLHTSETEDAGSAGI